MYDYDDYHFRYYSAQVLDFKFTGDSLWLTGVDYTRRDFFDVDVRALSVIEDKDLASKYSGSRYLMRLKWGNSDNTGYLSKNYVSECIRKVFKDLNIELSFNARIKRRNDRLKRCEPSYCIGFTDHLFKIRKVDGGTLFKCCFMGEREDNIVFVPDSGEISWPWNGYDKLGTDFRYGWYFDKKYDCNVLFLSSGGCREGEERHNLRLRMEKGGAVDIDSGVVLPYFKIEDAPGYPVYGCQIFKIETARRPDNYNYKLRSFVIDYKSGECSALKNTYGELSSLGCVNVVEGEVQPGLPYRKYAGADANMFKFESVPGAGLTLIECNYFGEREDRFLAVPTNKLNGWMYEYVFDENVENKFAKQASFGYSKCANGGVSLWLLLNGELAKEVRFYKDHADVRTPHGKNFRCEYRTHEQIVRGIVFGTIES